MFMDMANGLVVTEVVAIAVDCYHIVPGDTRARNRVHADRE